MNAEIVMFVADLLYGIPSMTLYIVVLAQLVRPKYKKQFSRPFFRLCFFIGVADCCGYVVFFLFYTLPLYSFLSSFFGSSLFSPSAFTTAMYFSAYLFGYVQLFGNCFLTFNRFTCIVFPLKHDRIWRYCFPISIVATVLSALAPCWYVSTAAAWYIPLDHFGYTDGFGFTTDNDKYPFFSNSFNKSLSNFVACALCLAMNVISSVFLIFHNSKMIGTTSQSKTAEKNLFFMTLIIFVVQSICGVHQYLIYIAMETKNYARVATLFCLLRWVNDLKFLSPAWVILIVSTSIRDAVLHAIPCLLLPHHAIGSMLASAKSSSFQGRKLFVVRK